jgi:sugar O-acyltransferase (sialic acid O-acetyltransferase NeuD family)
MIKKIILIGGGGHCASCIDIIEQENVFKIAGIVDENYDGNSLGYPSLGSDSNLYELKKKFDYALITIGQIKNVNKRIKLFNLIKKIGFQTPTIISPRAYVSKSSILKNGTVLMHGSTINSRAIIGDNCIINTNALVEHDSIIENHCHISTGAIINGNCLIKEGTFIGSNATIVQSSITKKNDFIKAATLFK